MAIQKKEVDRTQDINRLEVGFSPSDSINTYILSQLPSTFNIDNFIGDPNKSNEKILEAIQQSWIDEFI